MDKQNLEFIRLFKQSGWTQARAAQELGLTTGAISQFVSGIARPKSTVMRLFKLVLGDTSGQPGFGESTEPGQALLPLSGAEVELLREMRRLDDETRRKLLGAFKTVLAVTPEKKKGKK